MTGKQNNPPSSAGPAADSPGILLRRKAEAALQIQRGDRPPVAPEDAQRLLHELEVHQIELEMQNQELRRAQEQLEVSRLRYFDLYDLAPVGYFTLSEKGLILEVNLTACLLLGQDRSNLVRQPLYRFMLGDDADRYFLHRKKLFKTGEQQVFEIRMLGQDGVPFWARIEAIEAQDSETGAPVCRAVMSDITRRKQEEEALRESETRFRSYFDLPLHGIAITSVDKGWLQVNDRLCSILGYSRDEILRMTWEEITHPDDLAGDLANFHQVLSGCIDQYTLDKRFIRKDGSIVWASLGVGCVRKADGSVDYFVALVTDITRRRQAEEALRELKLAVEQSKDGIAFADREGNIKFANSAWAEMHGYTTAELIGRHLSMFHTAEQFVTDVIPFNEYAMKNGSREGEVGHVRKNGTIFPTWMTSTVVGLSDQMFGGWLGIARDITERKQAEQAVQAKNAELERFARAVSHDLKSPLVTIRTFLGHLVEDMAQGDKDRVTQDLAYVHAAAEKMNELLDELLKLSQVGRIKNPSVAAPLQEIVREALGLVAGRIDKRGVRVTVTDKPVMLYGDRVRLVEVFQNLIDNAVKFMGGQREPLIEIGAEAMGGEIACFVRDNGMGVDPRHTDKLFNLFEKLHPEMEGTGLGLALVKRILEVHGGRIWAESEGLGTGACFRFSMPQNTIQDA